MQVTRMRFPHPSVARSRVAVTSALLTAVLGSFPVTPALAQDSMFLACARFTEREQRVACLEVALQMALQAQGAESPQATSPGAPSLAPSPTASTTASTTAPAPATTAPAPATTVAAPETATAASATATTPASTTSTVEVTSEERSLLDRLRSFGRDDSSVSISSDDSGQDQLQDSISSLDKRNNLWIVTLSSGQVWRQSYPRQLLLREGDTVSIYREGIGNGFRLSTPRLSGFIRVERVK